MTTLRTCWRCHAKAVMPGNKNDGWHVACTNVTCGLRTAAWATQDEAVQAWEPVRKEAGNE